MSSSSKAQELSPERNKKESGFVNYLFQQIEKDKGFAAKLRRADNPATEYQSWEVLARFNVDLNKEAERRAYALIAAAISRSKAKANGKLPLGEAIANAFTDGAKSDQANNRLRRLIACHDAEEACGILRPLLMLIQSRVDTPLDFASLLNELRWFNHDPQRTKAKWAQQFYRQLSAEEAK